MKTRSAFPAGVRKCFREACPVVKKFRSGIAYCTMSCASQDGEMRVSPAQAVARAKKASRAAAVKRSARAAEKWANMTPAEAYEAGKKYGYMLRLRREQRRRQAS